MENESPSKNLLTSVDIECDSSFSEQNGWTIRHLVNQDLESVAQLCQDCFPLSYGSDWLVDVCNQRFIAFALFHYDKLTSLLVAELKSLSQCDIEDQDIGSNDEPVCYIMSLAVNAAYRRRGIATILLNHLKTIVFDKPPFPKIIFLHVLATNFGAINFYKQNGFLHHSTLPNYYQIHHIYHEAYTMVLNVNGHRSWTLKVKEVCSMAAAIVLSPIRYLFRLKFF
ncbi:N-alpha-acetyltransferase 60 [Aphelenchoides besseyi]|nr:N-alpha-acetyltransferase 60 [Aphelenchoides besseyi]KAI6226050.1 N-alpha-acetyltransferase 60 [Aphelenchoides besseyi]